MKCPGCNQPSLVETMTKGGVLVDDLQDLQGGLARSRRGLLLQSQAQRARALAGVGAARRGAVATSMPAVPHQPGRVAVPAARSAG